MTLKNRKEELIVLIRESRNRLHNCVIDISNLNEGSVEDFLYPEQNTARNLLEDIAMWEKNPITNDKHMDEAVRLLGLIKEYQEEYKELVMAISVKED